RTRKPRRPRASRRKNSTSTRCSPSSNRSAGSPTRTRTKAGRNLSPPRRALLCKGRQAFPGLPALTVRPVRVDPRGKRRLVEIRESTREHVRFCLFERIRPILEQVRNDARARRLQLAERHDLVHEADAARLFGAEPLAGERVAAHLAHPDGIVELRD